MEHSTPHRYRSVPKKLRASLGLLLCAGMVLNPISASAAAGANDRAILPDSASPEENAAVLAASGLTEAAEMALGKKTGEQMVIDGELSESSWSSTDAYDIDYLADFTISNNTSTFQVLWDESNLYIGVTVADADVVTADKGVVSENIYENDSIEIFVDGDNAKSSGYDKTNDYHIYIQHDGKILVQGGSAGTWGNTSELDSMQYKMLLTDTGYNLEAAIPFAALGITPADGTTIGLSMTNNDNDNYTGLARKEIVWNKGHNAGKPETWGTLVLYDTRKPLVSSYGTPVLKNGTENWDSSIWNFSDEYSLQFADIPGATLKFSSLSDYNGLYLGMLIEGAGDQVPYAEAVLSGTNGHAARVLYDHVMQWNPLAEESWQQMNLTSKLPEGVQKPASYKYNLGNGSYAVIVHYPWDRLSEVTDPAHPRANYSVLGFSIATGTDGNVVDGENTRWTPFNSWSGNTFENTAKIVLNNPNIVEMNPNVAPTGTPLFSYSIAQGGSVSGKVNVRDDNEGDVLIYTLEEGYDSSLGAVSVDATTGEWSYTTPSADFTTEGPAGVSFFVVASDPAGESFRTRIEVRVEPAPTYLTYYVDGDTGSDSNDGLSYDTALRTINAAQDKARPGDTVLIYESEVPYGWHETSEYDADPDLYQSVRNGAVVLSNSGLPDAPITYKAAPNQQPVICTNGTWKTLVISGSYITVEGLTVAGQADKLSYEDAYEVFWGKLAPEDDPSFSNDWGYQTGLYNTNGIEVGPLTAFGEDGVMDPASAVTHHVTLRNCLARNLSGTGIGGSECDYVTFENCTSVNNCWWDMWGCSGIGFIRTADIDDNTSDYKIVVRNCVSAGNRHFIPWKSGTVRLSDGNGIILDTMDDHEHGYQGKVLIASNLVYENGGSGIHAFRSDHVDIINNTIFNNGSTLEMGWSELFANDAEDVNMFNNIVYSRTGNKEDPKVGPSTGVVYDNNIFFNYRDGSSVGSTQAGVTVGANNQYSVDPGFTNVSPVSNQPPEGFDPETGYPASWYEVKTARPGIAPAQWSCAANAKAAGWYPDVNYDVTAHNYDFTLTADSPAYGAADAAWQAIAGGEAYPNAVGVFGTVGAVLEPETSEPTPAPTEAPVPTAAPTAAPTEAPAVTPAPSEAPDSSADSAQSGLPATGDRFAVVWPALLLALCTAGTTGLLLRRKRSRS